MIKNLYSLNLMFVLFKCEVINYLFIQCYLNLPSCVKNNVSDIYLKELDTNF